MAHLLRFLPILAITALAGSSFAGYTAITNPFTATTTDIGNDGAGIGDLISVQGGSFASFVGDTAIDPTITGGDLNLYRFNLDGEVTSFELGGIFSSFVGDYTIFYDLNANGLFDEGLSVSSGEFTLNNFLIFLDGTFTQTQGPSNPAFADLGGLYGNNPVLASGTLSPDPLIPTNSTGVLTLRQNAQPVPEPATMAALGLGALALVRRRARKA